LREASCICTKDKTGRKNALYCITGEHTGSPLLLSTNY
jgi:hypothetical protein